ncbi:MAG: hypothetical protein JW384_02185 [Nitrosomonadaceae bacterium]|nr:hypothetical protein [Nitrosomonadaceae bacterium]
MDSEEKRQIVRSRELGSSSETSVFRVVQLPVHGERLIKNALIDAALHIRKHSALCIGDDFVSDSCKAIAIAGPVIRHLLEQFHQADPVIFSPLGKTGSGKKGLLLICHQHCQRPPAASGHCLAHSHIEMVDIRPLLTVHFNRNKVLVQLCSNFLIFERFALHDVTPVASGIADGKEYRLILICGLDERFLPPRIPIDRVVGMLQQIRGFFMDQTILFVLSFIKNFLHGKHLLVIFRKMGSPSL